MSREHVEVVRRACSAWGDGEISTFREMYSPGVVAYGGGLWPDADGSVHGVDAIIHNFESVKAAFQRSELIPESFLDAGEKLVVTLLWRGVLPNSDSFIEQRLVCAYEFSDGLIVYTGWFDGLTEALDALELPRSVALKLVPDGEIPRDADQA
jgi:hypothetical protein